MKVCNKCGWELPESEFRQDWSTKDGLSRVCRDCAVAGEKAHMLEVLSRTPDGRAYLLSIGQTPSTMVWKYKEHKQEDAILC
jgi:hypothetical protein